MNSPSFNLVEEPWLPVVWRDGTPSTSVGLQKLFLEAHRIQELATDNPMETLALNRMLLALLASALPELVQEPYWESCRLSGQFAPEPFAAYFRKHYDGFDLLSPTRPFYGHPNPEAKEVSPLSRLQHAAASGNNAVLFSHELDADPQPMTLAEAARALVCVQGAALGGGIAQPFNFAGGPLIGGAFFWLRGLADEKPSLFQALLFNLPPLDTIWRYDASFQCPWERTTPPAPERRQVRDLRDLFTFQSRRLQLVLNDAGQAIGVRYNQGSKPELQFDDPHLAYVPGKEAEMPLRFSLEKSLWQNSLFYLTNAGKFRDPAKPAGHPPRTFEYISSVDSIQNPVCYEADVFGLINDQAKVETWRQERIQVFPDLLSDADRAFTLDVCLKTADEQHHHLREAARVFASWARLHKSPQALSEPERRECGEVIKTLGVRSRYWQQVGRQFPQLLARIATAAVAELDDVEKTWKKDYCQKTARQVLQETLRAYDLSGNYRAAAEAEAHLMHLHHKK